MEFLYGDSTPSPLTSNFLEFLRDAIDFGVFALHVDDEIALIHERERASAQAADEEIGRLDALGAAVSLAIAGAPHGADASETARCAAQLTATSAETVAGATAAVRGRLEAQRAELATEENGQRDACFTALEGLLLAHSPPESVTSLRIVRGPDRAYSASRAGRTAYGLAWRGDLGVPAGHPFASETPMEKLAPLVTVHAPEQTGWLKKEVKLKAQRLDRLVLVEALDDGSTVTLKLRTDSGGALGLDFEVNPRAGTVSATRAGIEGDPSAGAFEVPAEDVPALVALAEKVRTVAGDLTPTRLAEATLADRDVRQEPSFGHLVELLVSATAPIVREVSRHSLTATELVLRRLITSQRREEIFVAKSTLREKFAPLRPELREIFGRLELDTIPPPRASAPPTPEENDWPTRAELPRSDPPPPMSREGARPPKV